METRVERYRELRNEIQSESGEEVTSKRKTSEKVSHMLKDDDSPSSKSQQSISFDKICDAYELYDKGDGEKNPFKKQKVQIPFAIIIAIIAAAILSGLAIYLAVLLFGGK